MKVSIVIPTYKNLEGCLKKCIESLLKNSDFSEIPTEVIIVTNGCKEGTDDYVHSLGKPFTLLSTPEPIGFIKATNAGAAIANGEYLLFLNDDVVILDWGGSNGWLKMLMAPLEANPTIGLTCSNRDLWSEGRYFAVFFCAMTRRKLFLKNGLLDESFGLGCGEDCDYSLKIQDQGYKVVQVPVEHNHWHTNFPLFHLGHATFNDIAGDTERGLGNRNILDERYPRTDRDKELNREFSESFQHIHTWSQK